MAWLNWLVLEDDGNAWELIPRTAFTHGPVAPNTPECSWSSLHIHLLSWCFPVVWQNAWGTQLKEGWFILVHSLRGHHLDGREHRVAGVRWLGISHGVLPHLSFN